MVATVLAGSSIPTSLQKAVALCLRSIAFACAIAASLTMRPGSAAADDSDSRQKPAWAARLSAPEADGYRYFVGVISEASSREEALERSWLNAISGAARTQFPELLKLTESSTESLKGSKYLRESTLAVERVHWAGIQEYSKAGSPYFEFKEVDGKEVVTVYRLLRWKISDIEKERARLAAEGSRTGSGTSISYDSALGKRGAPTGAMIVVSDPPGALVLLDGEFAGKTNAAFARVGAATYQLAIQLEGYETKVLQVIVTPGETTRVEIKLLRNHGTVEVTSNPSGAVVYINNVPLLERTPLTFEREHGDWEVRVEAAGHYPAAMVVSIGYQKISEAFVLKAKPGKLSVITNPPGADVELGDQKLGKSNVINRLIPGGTYEIKVSKAGFLTQTKTVEINEARGQTAVFKLDSESTAVVREREEQAEAKSEAQNLNRAIRKQQISNTIWSGAGAAVAGVVAGIYQTQADAEFSKYENAKTADEAKRYHSATVSADGGAFYFSAISIGLLTFAAYNYYDWGGQSKVPPTTPMSLDFNPKNSVITISMTRAVP